MLKENVDELLKSSYPNGYLIVTANKDGYLEVNIHNPQDIEDIWDIYDELSDLADEKRDEE